MHGLSVIDLSVLNPRTWVEAANVCALQGGSLAPIYLNETNELARTAILGACRGAWIGGRSDGDGVWRWPQGDTFPSAPGGAANSSFARWAPSEPAQGDDGYCTELRDDGYWYARSCDSNAVQSRCLVCTGIAPPPPDLFGTRIVAPPPTPPPHPPRPPPRSPPFIPFDIFGGRGVVTTPSSPPASPSPPATPLDPDHPDEVMGLALEGESLVWLRALTAVVAVLVLVVVLLAVALIRMRLDQERRRGGQKGRYSRAHRVDVTIPPTSAHPGRTTESRESIFV
jgi:hypothetical protein